MNKKILLFIIAIIIIIVTIWFWGPNNKVITPSKENSEKQASTEQVASIEATSTEATTTQPILPTSTKTSANTKKQTINISPSISPLLKISYVGGVCPGGKICSSEQILTKTGIYYLDGIKKYPLNLPSTVNLSKEMEKTDYKALRAKTRSGTCPPTYGAQEITYNFYTSHGQEIISNCKVEIDFLWPLFKAVKSVVPPLF